MPGHAAYPLRDSFQGGFPPAPSNRKAGNDGTEHGRRPPFFREQNQLRTELQNFYDDLNKFLKNFRDPSIPCASPILNEFHTSLQLYPFMAPTDMYDPPNRIKKYWK